MIMPEIVGGCLCGSVRYSSDAQPVMTAVCHCPDCQKQSSSAFSPLVGVPSESLHLEGQDLASYETVGESGQPVTRRFCPECGSGVVSYVAAMPDLQWVKAGTLDDASWFVPQMHMWTSTAQPWVPFDESVPTFEKNPPLSP
jgi:hypothetical protein